MNLKSTLVLAALATVASAQAIIATTSTTTPAPEDVTWKFVGAMGGGSAVAVGPHTIISARHLGAANFVLGGVTYHWTSTVEGPVVNGVQTDLRIVTVAETLPGWYQIGAAPAADSAVTMVGFGLTGVVAASGDRYTGLTGQGKRRAGDNTVDGTFDTSLGTAHIAYLHRIGQSVLAGGDSGGGWFDASGNLIGVNSFIFNDTDWAGGTPTPPDKLPDFGFASANANGWKWSGNYQGQHFDINIAAGDPYFGSGAIDVTNSSVRQWAMTNGAVPEPATMAVLGLGALALARRRKLKG